MKLRMIKGGTVDAYLTKLKLEAQFQNLTASEGKGDLGAIKELMDEHLMLSERVAEIGENLRTALDIMIMRRDAINATTRSASVGMQGNIKGAAAQFRCRTGGACGSFTQQQGHPENSENPCCR